MKPGDVVWVIVPCLEDQGFGDSMVEPQKKKVSHADVGHRWFVCNFDEATGILDKDRNASCWVDEKECYQTEEAAQEAYCEQLSIWVGKITRKLGLAQQRLHAMRMANADII